MKAIVVTEFGGPEKMDVKDLPIPVVQPKQVLIQVAYASVNFADIKARYGNKGAVPPFVPGLDAAGVIVQIGSEVKHLQVGQRVMAFPSDGSYAEYVTANENLTFPIPDDLDFATAAACPTVSMLSYKLLVDVGRLEPGESVLVHSAAGGVGTTAIQMAKIGGAGLVIGTVGNRGKIETALKAGADHVICYEEEDFPARVNELTNGEGVDIVLDSLSGWVAEKSLDCLAKYGRLVHFGNSSGKTAQFKTSDLHSSCRSILGFSLGTTRKMRPDTLRPTAEAVLAYLASGRLSIPIGKRYKLEEANLAHAYMEARQTKGKILLEVKP